jgi:hypothetical protein
MRNWTLKSTVLPQADTKGSTRNTLASLGLRLRQQCQFLNSAYFVKTISSEGINDNKEEDCCQWIVSFRKNVYLEKICLGSSVDQDVAKGFVMILAFTLRSCKCYLSFQGFWVSPLMHYLSFTWNSTSINTRWFKYDRDKLWLVYSQIVPVIFEPPCTMNNIIIYLMYIIQGGSNMTGTICVYTSHSLSRSYLNLLV